MNSRHLKILAMCCMAFDHVTLIFPLTELLAPLSDRLAAAGWEAAGLWVLETLPHFLRYIGRLAAPVFLFGIAEGFAHTRSAARYLRRLLLTAVIAQPPYVLFSLSESRLYGLAGDWRAVEGSILWTMSLGLAGLMLCERLRRSGRPRLAVCAAFAMMLLSYNSLVEGGKGHVFLIFIFFYTRTLPKWQRALLYLPAALLARAGLVLWVLEDPRALSTVLLNVLGPYLGMLLTLCCTGEKGRRSKTFERLCYAFYPAHFAALSLAGFLRAPF